MQNVKTYNRWIMLLPTMLAAFMFALDETIANIALPHIAGSFSVSSQESIWVLTSYLIASCLTIPMIDWMSRLIGRKNMFILCVALFTAASFLCGIGMSLGMIPIITVSCKTIAPERMSNASGVQNFIKTIGGAIGTSLVATFISRFSQTHQNMMIHSLTETNSNYIERLNAYTSQFASMTDLSSAKYMAETMIYNQLNAQSHLWAYVDSFRIFAVAGLVVLLFVLLLNPNLKREDKKSS